MPTLTCPSTDLNFLSPIGFRLSIERLPNVAFFTQEIQLPTVTLEPLEEATPLSVIKVPSERLNFGELNITFAVDGQMNNWFEAFKWMRGLGFPEDQTQYTVENQIRSFEASSELAKNYSDAKLMVLGANNAPIRTFNFVDCFPSSLGGIQFGTTYTDVQYATASLTLEYSYFTVDNSSF